MISNFNELVTAVIRYSKRTDLQTEIETLFLPMALVRIGRDLKSTANEKIEAYAVPSTPPLAIPADFGRIRDVTYIGARGPRTLEPRRAQTMWPSQRGVDQNTPPDPYFYDLKNNTIVVAPAVGGEYLLNYFAIPNLSATQLTDPALTRHPQIFLYATLVELYIFTRDPENRNDALAVYGQDIQMTNRTEERSRAGTGAGIAVPWG